MKDRQARVSCKRFTRCASDYLEGRLSVQQKQGIERHLEECAGCRNYLRQMELTIQSLRELEEPFPSPQLRRELIEQFRAWKAKRDN